MAYELVQQLIGSESASTIHANDLLCVDANGVLQLFPADAAVWKYARCVLTGAAGTDVDTAYADDGTGTIIDPQPYLYHQESVHNYNGPKIEAWALNSITRATNDIAAPTGAMVAAKFTSNVTGYAYAYTGTISIGDEENHTFSCFVKAGNSDYTFLKAYKTSGNVSSYFQLTGADSDLTDHSGRVYIGNGWWRCWVRFSVLNSETAYFRVFLVDDTGATNTTTTGWYAYLWGAQVTEGNYIKPLYLTPTTSPAESGAIINTWDDLNHVNTDAFYYLEIEHNPYTNEIMETLLIGGVGILYPRLTQTGNNLITYPTSSTTGWTAFAAILSSVTFDGETGCLAVADNGTWSQAKQAFTAVVGTAYVVTCKAHNNNLVTCSIDIYSNGIIDTHYHGDLVYEPISTTAGWQEITFDFVATSTSLVLGFIGSGTTTSYLKDIVIKERDTDLIVLSDGTNEVTAPLPSGENKIGFAYSTTESKMRLNVGSAWGTEGSFDGSFGTGDITSKGIIRELQSDEKSYADAQTEIDSLMSA